MTVNVPCSLAQHHNLCILCVLKDPVHTLVWFKQNISKTLEIQRRKTTLPQPCLKLLYQESALWYHQSRAL
ncbi:hypothetical protein HanXRQr2_Chr06g0271171 [Helianthus annuus]|uniref:Uncharacterized protein n=1 Tax=Helianthus annuus TaxID=4232 RepID=A0A9K3IUM7_HELAN|nr:hypothetical protein HanXRQr2_Chr06g0271171 [Helianthus annuus]KAJ0916439.1 hypothetical protein HanPSC8_Chr06g0261721 [Helianthus annuus]